MIGNPAGEDEPSSRPLNTGCDEETASVSVGKDFSLVRTVNGRVSFYLTTFVLKFKICLKVLFSGKPSSLGLKIGGSTGKWNELPIPKTPRIIQVAVGHEGIHAVLVADDGAVYFVGTPRRGEDGDQSWLFCVFFYTKIQFICR